MGQQQLQSMQSRRLLRAGAAEREVVWNLARQRDHRRRSVAQAKKCHLSLSVAKKSDLDQRSGGPPSDMDQGKRRWRRWDAQFRGNRRSSRETYYFSLGRLHFCRPGCGWQILKAGSHSSFVPSRENRMEGTGFFFAILVKVLPPNPAPEANGRFRTPSESPGDEWDSPPGKRRAISMGA